MDSKNNAPISKKIPFSLDRFDGGLNNKSSEILMQDNQASDILNMSFSEDGLIGEKTWCRTNVKRTVN